MIDTGLQDFLMANFGNAPHSVPVGKVVRFSPGDNKHSRSCWVRLAGDIAFCGDWRVGDTLVWKSAEHERAFAAMNKYQRENYFRQLSEQQAKEEAEASKHKAKLIADYWEGLKGPAIGCDYFVRKQVKLQADWKQDGKLVVVPLYNLLGEVRGVQLFNDSFKWFMKNSQPRGAFYPVRNGVKMRDTEILFVVEGLATGLSAFELLECYSETMLFQVIVCFNAGNLPVVVSDLRASLPGKRIVGLADNDEAGIKAMEQAGIQYVLFDGPKGWDVNDAWLSSKHECLAEFCRKFASLK